MHKTFRRVKPLSRNDQRASTRTSPRPLLVLYKRAEQTEIIRSKIAYLPCRKEEKNFIFRKKKNYNLKEQR